MRKSTIVSISMSAILLVTQTVAIAAEEDNAALMRKIYSQLSDVLTIDKGALEKSGSHLEFYAAGGILIDPSLDMNNLSDRILLYRNIGDIRLPEGWVVTAKPGTLSSRYREILDAVETPNYELNEDEKKKYNAIRRQFYSSDGEPRAEYARYLATKLVMAKVNDEAYLFYKNNPNENSLPLEIRQRQIEAENQYRAAKGVEHAGLEQKLNELSAKMGTGWVEDMKQTFNASFIRNGNVGNVLFYPKYSQWLNNELSWKSIVADSKSLERQSQNTKTSVSGGLSGGWGLWSWGGNYSKDTTTKFEQTQASNLSLAFEVLNVRVDFPWLDFMLFESHAWRFNSGGARTKNSVVSDGQYNPDQRDDKELLPLVPVNLLIARNVTLSADWSFNLETFFNEKTQGGGSIGWGPFRFGGNYYNEETRTYQKATAKGNSITFKNPQIIGYLVYEVPKSPEPDPNLPWGEKILEEGAKAFVGGEALPKPLEDMKRLQSRPAALMKK